VDTGDTMSVGKGKIEKQRNQVLILKSISLCSVEMHSFVKFEGEKKKKLFVCPLYEGIGTVM
jgi:predicted PP-loop superfamily ATPase